LVDIGPGDHDADAERDSGVLDPPDGRLDPGEGAAPAPVDPEPVMKLRRAIDADADRIPVTGEKLQPLIVQQGAIGLQRVVVRQAAGVLGLQVGYLPVNFTPGRVGSPPCQMKLIDRSDADSRTYRNVCEIVRRRVSGRMTGSRTSSL
jgi:hypothetical protein